MMDQNKTIRFRNWGVRILAATAIIIGSYWLITWLSGRANQMSFEWIRSGKIIVKTNMALCQVLAGVSLLLTILKSKKNALLLFRTALLSIVLVIGSLTLWENLSGMDLGIDQILARETPGALATNSPNRMGLFASLNLVLLGLGFLLNAWNRRISASYIGLAVCLISLVPAVGYFLSIDEFYSLPKLTGIAWPSVLAMISLGLGLVFVEHGHGIIDILLRDNPGGLLLRRLLPAILLIPLIVAFFIMKGERSGIYDSIAGTGLLVLTMVFILMIIAFITARALNHADAVRKNIEFELRKSKERLDIALEAADLGTWDLDTTTGKAVHSLRHDQIFGYQEPQKEWSLDITLKHVVPEDRQIVIDAHRDAGKTGNVSLEARVKWPDGSIHWINSCGRVEYDKQGLMIRQVGVVSEITKRKMSENALRDIERRYSALFANKINGMAHCRIITDKNGKPIDYWILQINEAYERIIGIRKADIEGHKATEVFPEIKNYKLDYIGMYGKLALERGEIKFEEYFEASGQYLSIYAYSPVLGEFIAMFTDVTDRIKTEEALRESEKKYKDLVTNARSIIINQDNEGRITFINEFAQKFFGYREDEIIGKSAIETIVPKTESTGRNLGKMLMDLYKDPEKYSVNINENIKKSGERVWIEYHNKPLFDNDGRRIGHISVGIDITKRKSSEAALQAAREKLNLALESGNIGLWEWNLETDEMIWDEKLEKMFGLEPRSFGKTLNAFENLVNEEDLPHVRRAVSQTLEKDLPFETIYRTRSGKSEVKYISAKASVRKDINGKPVSLIGVCSDVTGLKKETDQLIFRLNDELLRSNKELENFAYVASHDLQEPLRMVTSFTQLLQKRYKDKLDEDANTYIHFAVDGSKRMYDLLNGLLAYSRINTRGKEFSEVNMNAVVEKVKVNLNLKINETQAVIYHDDLPAIKADEIQMIQLVQNLVENGIKFSKGIPMITISSESINEHFVFSVKDEGLGIEPQYFERIFRIFQRLHPKEEYGGMGVGLAICQRIVERHKGKIWVESVPGKGSTFFFTIP